MTYKIGSIGEFAAWTKAVVRDPRLVRDTPRKWFDSEATAARNVVLAPRHFDDPADRRRWLRKLLAAAERRARKAGLPFDLPADENFLDSLWKDGRCVVTGLSFNLHRFPEALVKHPFAPSLDRRLSSHGYTRDNVRLVCVAVNFGMGQWGEEVYLKLARAAVDHEGQALAHASDQDWQAGYRERIAAAEALLADLPESERAKQRRRVAGLKSALAKGPTGLQAAAAKAAMRRTQAAK